MTLPVKIEFALAQKSCELSDNCQVLSYLDEYFYFELEIFITTQKRNNRSEKILI